MNMRHWSEDHRIDDDRSAGWEHRVPLQYQLDEAEAEVERLTAQRDRLRNLVRRLEEAYAGEYGNTGRTDEEIENYDWHELITGDMTD